MTELAQRAVASKGWRWLPGMRAVSPSGKHWRVWSDTRSVYEPEGCMDSAPAEWSKDVPDLTDDLTRLGLLALVREAWGDWSIVPVPGLGAWGMGRLCSGGLMSIGCSGETEAEALVAALEAAP